MSEVLAPPNDRERRSTRVHLQTHDSAGIAISTPKHDCNSRLPHPSAPMGHKNGQAVNSDHQQPPGDRRQSTWNVDHVQVNACLFPGTRHHLTTCCIFRGPPGIITSQPSYIFRGPMPGIITSQLFCVFLG